MKKIVLTVFILISLALIGVYFFSKTQRLPTQVPVPTATVSENSFCSPQDVQATLSLDPGAGNMHGSLVLKNISSKKCQIVGSNFIAANYDQTVKNLAVTQTGTPEKQVFDLAPGKSLYSQVHYPNGPQCSSGISTTKVSFTYQISPSDTITFVDQEGKKEQDVTICTSPSDITTIQVWNISERPITQ